MVKIYKSENNTIEIQDKITKNCWVSLVHPTMQEIAEVSKEFHIDEDHLRAPLDEEERSRIEFEDEYTLILVDVPIAEKKEDKESYGTMPLGIIVTEDVIFTICLQEVSVLTYFEQGRVRGFYTYMKTRFLLQILYKNASMYLQYLRAIDRKSEAIEDSMKVSTRNRELLEIRELEKSLVYLNTSLRGNEAVLERLLRSEKVKQYPEDRELLEDVIIENKQAIEMGNVYAGILTGTMEAFAAIINNNLNIAMKFLAAVTIILSIPNIISGFYGMNVNAESVPLATEPFAFGIIVGIAVLICIIIAIIFKKKKMF